MQCHRSDAVNWVSDRSLNAEAPVFPLLLHPTPVPAILRNELNAGLVRLLNYARKGGVRAGAMGRLFLGRRARTANPASGGCKVHVRI
jgi:hypothetical protein